MSMLAENVNFSKAVKNLIGKEIENLAEGSTGVVEASKARLWSKIWDCINEAYRMGLENKQ